MSDEQEDWARYGVILHRSVVKGKEVKSFRLGTYDIAYCKDYLQIGCEVYTFQKWWSFSDDEIKSMEKRALDYWRKNKELIKKIVEESPCK